jgi:polyhydroxyalkanoate synthesis regulator protein
MMENMTAINPMAKMPGFEALQAQQEAFLKAMSGGFGNWKAPADGAAPKGGEAPTKGDDLDDIKKQLAELQSKLNKMN